MYKEFQKVWVIYLITSYTIFTLPEPVFSQINPTGPMYVRSANSTSTTTEGPTGRDASDGIVEPIALASSFVPSQQLETLIAEASSHHHGRGVHRKHPPQLPRPPRWHPPPLSLSPHKKAVLIKKPFNNKIHVPKSHRDHSPHQHHKEHEKSSHPPRHLNRERDHESEGKHKHRLHSHEDSHTSQKKHDRHSLEVSHNSHEQKHYHRKVSAISSESSTKGSGGSGSISSKRDRSNTEPNKSFIEDEFYRGGNSGTTGNSVQDERFYSDERVSREVSPTSIRSPNFPYKDGGAPLPFPKPPKPVQLSYYYDSDDGKDLKDLVHNHHLRRRKDCDGLDNFVYDLEIIAFFLGLIAAGIGFYADVIPFFNEGVKISYNNDLINPGGDGIDFPHEYWPIKGPTKAHIHKRTIQIGTDQDNQREVLSVAGEFIGGAGLILSFIGLFPSIIEKFFYSLDWWFGKRGLWKQYLYTYKCEIHPYPQPGWGR
ncbi:unnamed protein product [Orchesella dallaii]|uniref:Uncharacterized protein n=1 Tax=Orchesella dallaii TaxID=48710 RepID=A0ABP1QEA1_9HEXA